MPGEHLKVGQLAKRTGLSVRTLHHYDEIGLLRPSQRTASGHRLYGPAEVRRLQQIASLRQLGLSLEDIGLCLADEGLSFSSILELQVQRLREDIEAKERLCALLEGLQQRLDDGGEVSVEDVTRAIAGTVALERYYTPEQLQRLTARRKEIGEGRIDEAQREWAELFDAFGAAMDGDMDPGHETVQALARRARRLILEFTGGDAEIEASLARMYDQEGGERVMHREGMAVRPGLWAFMTRASEALAASEGSAD